MEDPKSNESNPGNTPISTPSQKSKTNNPNKEPESANSSPGSDKVNV